MVERVDPQLVEGVLGGADEAAQERAAGQVDDAGDEERHQAGAEGEAGPVAVRQAPVDDCSIRIGIDDPPDAAISARAG